MDTIRNRYRIAIEIDICTCSTAWKHRIRIQYGNVTANWVDLKTLIRIKSHIDHPRHQEDARVLREVRKRTQSKR